MFPVIPDNFPSIFEIHESYSPEILALLEKTTLGSNGAIYRHLLTSQRINEIDNPIFLTAQRNGKPISNVTFCRRDKDWYIRYFAFDSSFQSSNKRKSVNSKKGLLKKSINDFYLEQLNNNVASFYAYIDPKNDRSLDMSQTFDFKTEHTIATQTFSRTKINIKTKVKIEEYSQELKEKINKTYSNHKFFHPYVNNSQKFFTLRDANNNLVAMASTNIGCWKIERLPGRFGNAKTKLISFIPLLRKLIQPNRNEFLAIDNVWYNNDPDNLQELFEGILLLTNQNVIFWWVDQIDPIYNSLIGKINWGLLNKVIGVNQVSLVTKRKEKESLSSPAYVLGMDFI